MYAHNPFTYEQPNFSAADLPVRRGPVLGSPRARRLGRPLPPQGHPAVPLGVHDPDPGRQRVQLLRRPERGRPVGHRRAAPLARPTPDLRARLGQRLRQPAAHLRRPVDAERHAKAGLLRLRARIVSGEAAAARRRRCWFHGVVGVRGLPGPARARMHNASRDQIRRDRAANCMRPTLNASRSRRTASIDAFYIARDRCRTTGVRASSCAVRRGRGRSGHEGPLTVTVNPAA